MTEVTQVPAAEAIGLVERDEVWLLDVREPHEWALGHAPEAHHLPMGQLGARLDELPADASILVVCHLGMRSERVAQALEAAGFESASVTGGMSAWVAAGGSAIDDAGRPGRID
ncbi:MULTISPECIES: rhodanese-like domain-containing protein [unclassified Rathayibacter]|uniref:rhodanese-like domain-containing protein n=1 Tax=unclassified Rathayibacter TaxID=2609250 RepID=UPI00188C9694|nr:MULTISPECIES: rhodanese-like domain-containing protein [unclassified Rathayibacter]MBF4462462.1 rhodanese-like domain-containing protein [Rathayibacter sp. VKM Ac-2879]MBF4503495.1 rhodanese-like domain-containing protein [Rathayibacter sp. VKM Ac-2878]